MGIFYQRPLKSQKHLIGKCEYEPNRRRAPKALPEFQYFRILSTLNNTEIRTPAGEILPLTDEQRKTLTDALQAQATMSFAAARKKIGLTTKHRFNWEEGTEKGFNGNKTASKIIGVFGKDRWAELGDEERNQIIEDLLSIEKEETLKKRGINKWGLDEESAEKLASIQLEPGYCSLSRQALKKLIPLMEKGTPYMTAIKECYSAKPTGETHSLLPSVDDALDLRNPCVHRALTEMRKVVNNLVGKYGKPQKIRVEMARDLKNSAKKRKEITKRNDQNRKARENAKRILEETGIQNPSGSDITKWLLAEECEWECPYTGKSISVQSLFGANPEFDIEHIIPFSRSLDNSFMNKTLCYADENRHVKKGSTPYEAYGRDEKRWEEILQRVNNFKGSGKYPKMRLFRMKEASFDEFSERHLNDTRYISKLAKEYLGMLYGEDAFSRVQAVKGGTTHFLRDEWCLNEILNDGGEKTRDDHRHHAVDAVVIALTSPTAVKEISIAAREAERQHSRRLFASTKQPWKNFTQSVRDAIEKTIVSHRVNRKTNGPLHEESFYSIKKDEKGQPCLHIRKPAKDLTEKDLSKIVDPVIRDRVGEWLKQKKDERTPWPVMNHGDYKRPIRNVRIRKSNTALTIGSEHRSRNVLTGSNHHLDIFEIEDKKGNPKWIGRIVTSFEAMQRKSKGIPIYSREHESGGEFKFSLSSGEMIELKDKDGKRGVYRVRTISQGNSAQPFIEYIAVNDARLKADIKQAKEWKKISLEPLRKLGCQKVTVTPLGEVRRAND